VAVTSPSCWRCSARRAAAGTDARLEVVAARTELLDVGRVAQEHDTRR
jgi:hypothetical protein